MYGRIRRNFAAYTTFHVVRHALPIIITPFLAHYLGDAYGPYVIIYSCSVTATIFMEYGFNLYGINAVAAADGGHIEREVSAIISAKIALLPVCVVAYVVLTAISGVLFSDPASSMLGCIVTVAVGGNFGWYFQGRQRGATAVSLEGVPQLAALLLFILLVRSPGDLWLAYLAMAVTLLASVVISVMIIRCDGVRLRFDRWAMWSALVGARPYFVERFCYTFSTSITPMILSILSSVQEAAIYSIGSKVFFLGSLALPVSQTMMPVIAAQSSTAAWKTPVMATSFTAIFCGTMACIVYFAAGPVIAVLFSRSYDGAIPVAQTCCIAAFLSSITMALANFVIIPRGAANVFMRSATTALCVSLVFQLALIPRYGAMGAAIARTATEFTTIFVLLLSAIMLFRGSKRAAS
jgi:O-antigen/teichoic acid export membrane protein